MQDTFSDFLSGLLVKAILQNRNRAVSDVQRYLCSQTFKDIFLFVTVFDKPDKTAGPQRCCDHYLQGAVFDRRCKFIRITKQGQQNDVTGNENKTDPDGVGQHFFFVFEPGR